jgi:hypothetical protein
LVKLKASSRTPIVVLALVIALGDVLMMMSQPRPRARIAVFAAISLFLGFGITGGAPSRGSTRQRAHPTAQVSCISLLTCASWDGLTFHTASLSRRDLSWLVHLRAGS